MNDENIQIPNWAKVVGIIIILCGILGLWVAEYSRGLAEMAEMEKLAKSQHIFRNTPDWFHTWSEIIGLLGLLVNALYIYVGFALLQLKRFAIRLFYLMVALSIGFAVLRQVIFAKVLASFPAKIALGLTIAIVLINIILPIIVLAAGKEAFRQEKLGDTASVSKFRHF